MLFRSAFTIDPYSHSTGFSGVQQPGMTGQVKEDVISRFYELGVTVKAGELHFSPRLLKKEEFVNHEQSWHFSTGKALESEKIEPGSLAFTLCGTPVIYRLSDNEKIEVHRPGAAIETVAGQLLGTRWSESLFQRDGQVGKLVVYVNESSLRD